MARTAKPRDDPGAKNSGDRAPIRPGIRLPSGGPRRLVAVDLEPGRRERSVAALVKRQFAGIDNAPHLKAQAREQLLAQTLAAQAAGGLEMSHSRGSQSSTCRRT
jgi:hypothetical protein